jgi:hypothetical protein
MSGFWGVEFDSAYFGMMVSETTAYEWSQAGARWELEDRWAVSMA